MAKNFNPRTAESLFKQKLRTMIGSTAHTQNIADQAMELAEQFMTEDEISNSDAYRVIENVSCVCVRKRCRCWSKNCRKGHAFMKY